MFKYSFIKIFNNIIFSCILLHFLSFFIDFHINFLVTAFCIGIVSVIVYKPNIKIYSNHLIFLGLFMLCTFITVALNSEASFSYYRSYYISPLVALLIPVLFQFTNKKLIILMTFISLIFFLNANYINYQFIKNIIPERPDGFFYGYMVLCGLNLLILPIIFTFSIYENKLPKYLRIFFLITIIFNIPAIIFENTRIVWIALSIVFPMIIFISIKNKIKALVLIFLMFLYSFCCFQISPHSTQRFETISSTNTSVQSNYERLLMWKSATNMFFDHPLIGVGIGNYHEEYILHYQSPLSKENQYHPHNVVLSMLAQTGIIGTIGYLLLFIYLYYKAISSYIKKKNVIDLAYFSSLLAFSINGLTDCNFVGHNLKGLTYIFYLITGIYLLYKNYIILIYTKK